MAGIRFQSIRKVFGKTIAANDVSLEIKDGEFMVLLGPSGCGKTTLLRCLAGLERVDGGRVFIGERDVTDLPPRDRKIAMVFQSYAVFPHLTVFDNIAFGLKMQNRPRDEIKRRVEESARLLELSELLGRYPAQLSGGQRQRVAVARAIVMQAAVLLMDEPLSNLDALLRLQMRAELKRLHQEIKATTIYVTHDQVEALSLGDRIAVMQNGRIVQCDAPMNIYDYPANKFVGGFIGTPPMNFLPGTVRVNGSGATVIVGESHIAPAPAIAPTLAAKNGQPILLGIRPENLALASAEQVNTIRARVRVIEPLGSHKLLTVQVGNEISKVSVAPDERVALNDDVWLHFDPEKIRWMDAATGEAISPVVG
jgi:multiple sugar transport system ATP-binding protein